MCALFSVEEDIWSKFSVAALPADEKEKLYKAIDYNENVRVKYPTEVWKIILNAYEFFNLVSYLQGFNHTLNVESYIKSE